MNSDFTWPCENYFYQTYLTTLGNNKMHHHHHFLISLLISTKKTSGILTGITLNPQFSLEETAILAMLSLSSRGCGMFFHLFRAPIITFSNF